MDPETKKQQTVHVNRMKLSLDKQVKETISKEKFEELVGNSDKEDEGEFHGFEDLTDDEINNTCQ